VGLIESENLDPVYKGIGEIIGVCIDRLVTDGVRKGTLEYIRNIIPPGVRDMIQKGLTPIEGIIEALIVNAHLNGFGKFELVDFLYNKDDDDFETVHVTDPFSVPLCAGVHAGACEAVTDRSNEVIYSETFPASTSSRPLYASMPGNWRRDCIRRGIITRRAASIWRGARPVEAPRPFPDSSGTWRLGRSRTP